MTINFGPIYALKDELLRDQNYEPLLFWYLDANYISWLGYVIYIFYSFGYQANGVNTAPWSGKELANLIVSSNSKKLPISKRI